MLSRFFVDRPIFAWVVAIVIMLAGALAINTLPVSQYPNIAPPQITITATYPGANAETMSRTVTQVIEQEMTGLDGFMYMSSNSDSTGRMYNLGVVYSDDTESGFTHSYFAPILQSFKQEAERRGYDITFIAGTNPDIAQVQVQNKLSKAETRLPQTVRQLGVTVEKSKASFLMVVAFIDETHKLSSGDLGDYLVNNVKEPVARVKGVGQVTVFGASYAMRVWMDPGKLYKYSLQPSDVIAAIESQNVQVAAGDIAGQPTNGKRMIAATVRASYLLNTPEQFDNIALKSLSDGSVVRIKDIGYSEIGQQTYTFEGKFNNQPSSAMAISLAAGANSLETSRLVREKIEELSPYYPEGIKVVYPADTTLFVKEAMKEVVKTLIEAIILVIVVMYLFLQNPRATIIPTIAVPVVLLGTLGVLGLMGYSINMLTMFALVLAIGLLVDDAIIVVENVERVMTEDKTSAREATLKSMSQISGALIGVAVVLSAVFIPMAFFGGSTGVIYRQFSVTIVSAMTLSVIVALTLTPALCATMLKPVTGEQKPTLAFFRWFNASFNFLSEGVRRSVQKLVRRILLLMLVYGILVGGVVWGFMKLPGAFMPDEDQGALLMLSSFGRVWLSAALWNVARQAPPSTGILQAGILEWAPTPSSRASS